MQRLVFKRFATNLGGTASKNGRDSAGRHLGPKLGHGAKAFIGNVLLTQRGTGFRHGRNVAVGKNDTLFALRDGFVKYEKDDDKRTVVSVDPFQVFNRRKIVLHCLEIPIGCK